MELVCHLLMLLLRYADEMVSISVWFGGFWTSVSAVSMCACQHVLVHVWRLTLVL